MVNSDPTSTWVAKEYPKSFMDSIQFNDMTGDISSAPPPSDPYIEPVSVPENFDGRVKWGKKLGPVRAQASCGGCWAITSAEMLGARLAIKGCLSEPLSPQYLISCNSYCYGCTGCTGERTLQWLVEKGTVTEACVPYVSGNGKVPACPSRCQNGSALVRYRIRAGQVHTRDTVQSELYNNGPVYFRFSVYTDLMNYGSGIYTYKYGTLVSGHAVLLVGWGVENGVKYWILQNSWGPTWGEQGFFRMRRGTNECNCENAFYSGIVGC